MKLKGEYILRQIDGQTLVVPVGEAALALNGMVCLNGPAAEIWACLERELDRPAILAHLLDTFAVGPAEAARDLEEFLQELENYGFLAV